MKHMNQEDEHNLLSKLKISSEMMKALSQLDRFLSNLFRDASKDDDQPIKKKKTYLVKANSNDKEINDNVQNILKDFLENPKIEQKIYVEDISTKDKLLANTNKFLENLSDENLLKLQEYYIKDELPQLYVEANKDKQNIEGQKFSVDLLRQNVHEFLVKNSVNILEAKEKMKKNNADSSTKNSSLKMN